MAISLSNMIIFFFIVQISLILFDATYSTGTYDLNDLNQSSSANPQNSSAFSLFEFIVNPTGWTSSSFFSYFTAYITAGAVFAIGLFLVTKTDVVILFPFATWFLTSFVAIPVSGLYNMINREVATFACTPSEPCTWGVMIASLTVGVLAWAYAASVLQWWSGRPT